MYREMFWEFSSSVLYRQEVVGALITHCGAGSAMETDSALSALSALASPRCGVAPFYLSRSSKSCRFLVYQVCCVVGVGDGVGECIVNERCPALF